MSDLKISEVVKKKLIIKAEKEQEEFTKDVEKLLRRYGLTSDILRQGLKAVYSKSDDKNNEWYDRVTEDFVGRETVKFMGELSRLEHYFDESMPF